MSPSHHVRNLTVGAVAAIAAFVAWPGAAEAQAGFQCKSTETQPECHARLKCRADEDLEDCQRRLRDAGERRDDQRDDDRARGSDDDRRGGSRSDRRDRGRDDDRARSDRRGRGGRDRSRRGGGRRGGGGDRGGFVANKTFGLGLELGQPSGLTGKYFFADKVAFDFGVGWIYRHYYYDDGLHLYGDVLFHPVSLASNPSFELPLYIGFGLRFWDFEYCYQNVCGYDGSVVGLRIPFGIAFDFNNAPIDIFLQLVPTFDFVDDDYRDRYDDRTHTGIDLSAGFRFWFN